MTDPKPDPGDLTESTDDSPELEPESAEGTVDQPVDVSDANGSEAEGAGDDRAASGSGAAEESAPEGQAEQGEADPSELDAIDDAADAEPVAAEDVAELADADPADAGPEAAPAGAAWTTTPVAPDPEATEAALAALAAKPETVLEPPDVPPPTLPSGGEPPDEGTPVLLVGGILVGAFIVALAIVLILFRPFDNVVDPTLSPSPVVTEAPSASPSTIPAVDTPDFKGLSLEDAELTAEDYGLVVRANPVETDEEEPGTVLDQDPSPGESVEPGSTVELSVAVATPTESVPDIVDLPEADAISALDAADLVPGDRTEANDETIIAGNVISSAPLAAEEVAPGSEVAYVVSIGPEAVPVPDIVDLPEADAISALDAADLVPGDRTEANDETIIAGNVISSAPLAAEEVAPGSEVAYVVSIGPEAVPVPDIVDLPEADAISALDAADLVPGDRTEANDETIIAGNVISSAPLAAEEVAPGSEVAYVVSIGPEAVPVPDIVDLPEADAISALDAADLVPGDRTEANDETIIAGNVISSAPLAAEEVAPGSEVAYVVSIGPEAVPVPDIVDLPEADAISALDAADLVPGDRTEANDETIIAGNVISSAPLAAEEVAPGSEVAYVVSIGPEAVPVPDIVDLPEADAISALDAADLVPGDRTEANDETIIAGNVISSAPLAAEEVAPGSEVAYVVSIGPEAVPVPDIVDLPEADAISALDAADLVPGDRTEANDETIIAGNVISSAPLAAEEVAPGSEVAYVVSIGPEAVPVPDIVDLPEADAISALDAADLVPGDRTEANDETIIAGNVISSAPLAAEEVAPGSEVAYVVSIGPEAVPVPDIVDLPEADAISALDAADLVPGDRTEANDETIIAGNVISSAPLAAEEVAPGSEVAYVVSIGPEAVPVPDIVDLPEADAISALDAADLVPGDRTEANDETIIAGNVISSAPLAAEEVAPGSEVAYVVSIGPEAVPVPDIVDLPEADAISALDAADLVPGDRTEANDETIIAGNVISSAPLAAEEVAPGSEVAYVVSIGPEAVETPNFVGLSIEQAQVEAEATGVALLSVSVEAAGEEPGTVLGQNPAAGVPVFPGSTITLSVAVAPVTVQVPDLSGAAADAEGTLAAAGLVGSSSDAFSDSVAVGDVISQDPSAGSSVDIGSTVSYVISLGVEQVQVPDLSGAAADAEGTLAAAGLVGSSSDAFSDSVAVGDVISQDPSAGSSVDIGSTVSYVISLGVEQVQVPDVRNLSEADATTSIEAAGLSVGEVDTRNHDSVPADEAIRTNPAAGETVDIGSAVVLIMSSGPAQVDVPDVVGSPAADAEGTLAAAGLVGSSSDAFSDSVAVGDVISQDPSAGSSVDIGSTVSYVISLGVEQVQVPDVRNLSEADATTSIEAAGLSVGEVDTRNHDSVPADEAIRTNPAAGETVDIGSAVVLIMSSGPAQVDVPDVVGSPAADAEGTLAAAGLVGSSSDAFSDSVAVGDVISQDPSAGSSVDIGSTVSYVISLGVEQVQVPDLSGAAADAEGTLAAAGLVGSSSDAFSDSVAVGDVISQDPSAGSSVDIGSTVSYVISLGVEQVQVPDVRNLSEADATTSIEAAGLSVGEVDTRNHDSVPADEAIRTNPAAGETVDIGSAVVLIMSSGPAQVDVPDVVGSPAADAEGTLAAAGLVGSSSDAFSDSVAVGDVISQDPSAGSSVDIGSTVSYVISLGVEQVQVPDLSGAAADAEGTLAAAGLVGSSSDAFSDSVAVGDVISQDPSAGSSVDIGSTVSYVISLGVEQVQVPDVRNLSEADATTSIEAAGLSVGEVDTRNHDSVPADEAIRTNPAAGETVDIGSAVVLIMSSGPAQVDVPDVVGSPAADAEGTLAAAGLVGSSSDAFSDSVAVGDVISQDPSAGSSVDIGSTVSYVISLGVEQVQVPDLSGAAADAEGTLAAAGLVGSSSDAFSDSVAVGDVISQDPSAGSSVDIGSTVSYVISLGAAPNVDVKTVRDLPEADAIAALEADGLVVSTQDRANNNVAAGNAIKTEPAAGETVPVGSDILLTISTGPKPVAVPDIVGSKKAKAKTDITAAGLTVGEESVVEDASAKNTVLAQDPPAGTEVPDGSRVDYTVSSGPPAVTIPDVKDSPAADAQAALEADGLVVSTQDRANNNVAAGNAIKTEPAAGETVPVGSDVLLTISTGPKPVAVPDIVGSKKAKAKTDITAAGLTVGEESVVEDASAKNTVLAQDPPAGTEVPAGSRVDYTVSSGPPAVTIPDVKDSPATDAQAALEADGLVVSTQDRANNNVAAGNAIKTEPAAGETVPVGSDVLLTISTGPKPVAVPDIVGSKKAKAKTDITAAGLTVGEESVVEDASAKNTVLAQDPPAGTEVPDGSRVDYTVSSGPPAVTIPDVKDSPAADAQAALEADGLVVSTQDRANNNVAAGNAIKTEPAAGETVPVGSDILLTISTGPKPVAVPDIVGSKKAKAKTDITAAGLTVGEESVVEDASAKNTVLAQDPPAGTEVPDGSRVDYTVSSGPPAVTIPDVKDSPAADAQAALEADGLVVSTQDRANNNVAAGNAIKTEPAAGETVPVGSDVLLTISTGPKPVAVPDIVGSKKAKAKTDITAAGLTVGEESVVEDASAKNTVLEQDPPAGTEVPDGSRVDYTVSSGPPAVTIPDVKDSPAADAQAALEADGLVVSTQDRANNNVAAGNAIKTEPAAGETVPVGSDVLLTISTGPKQVIVPDVVGTPEADASATLADLKLQTGARTEAIDEAIPAGAVISQDPTAGSEVDEGAAIDLVVSLGPPIQSRGEGGSLDNPTVSSQLDVVAATVPDIRQLELGNTPYDGASRAEQRSLVAERANILYDPSTLNQEQEALRRMGLLGPGDDLASLLDQLYGQELPIVYLETRGRQSINRSIDKFNVGQRAQAAREFGRAATFQRFGSDATRVGDATDADAAAAGLALEQGDGTLVMLDWARDNVGSGNQAKVDDVIVPGNDGVFESMPQLLQREYSFPFLEGRAFVSQLLKNGGWDSVDASWARLPESTEQVMHPKKYGSDRPTSIDMNGVSAALGGDWSERWQQTMGELRLGVWLADGQPGTQDGPRSPVKLPKANAAAGWGGDRLVSLNGPDGSWAIVWQTKWDTPADVGQFTKAASTVVADLPGSHAVLDADASSGVSNPALVILTSDAETLARVADALGVGGALGG